MDEQQESSLHFLDYWRVIRSRKEIILAIALLVVLTGTGVTLMMPKQYASQARIEIRPDTLDIPVFQQHSIGHNPYFLRTQYEIIQSKPIINEVIRNLNLQEVWGRELNPDGSPISRARAYAMISNGLTVRQFRETNLVAIRLQLHDYNMASRIANEIAAVYRDHRMSQKRGEIQRAVDSMKNELTKQQERVAEAEARVEQLRSELGVSMLGTGIRADKVQLQRLQGDRISARVDMLTRKARLTELESLSGDELMTASSYIVGDPTLSNLRQQLMDTEVSLRLNSENYGENHPEVRRLRAAREKLEEQLDRALAGMIAGVRADYRVALQKLNALEEELENVSRMELEVTSERYLPFENAMRDLELQRSILQALEARITQEGIELEVPRTPVEIVDRAEPSAVPVSPNLVLNVVLSLVLGMGAGIGLAFFIEYLDTSVKNIDDIERYLDLPVVGVIPQKVLPLIEEGSESPHAEAYRVMRTNLQFANQGMTGGAFAVVSGGVGEGKSMTLFNLAYVTAQLGDKVLIVDSDLRRPVQHKILKTSNSLGLTNVLMRDVPIEETIKATSVPNLHFLPSGRLPRSSVGLLDTQKMRELIKNLKARYDYVFFDSPPIMGVSDASILSSEVDAVLLVVQYRKYPRAVSSRAKRIVDNVGGRLIGVVLNNINIMRDDYYYYYHPYYSRYGQYGDTEGEDAAAQETRGEDEF